VALTDYYGKTAPVSASTVDNITWLDPLQPLFGTALADKLTGGGAGHVMTGYAGDDTYVVKAAGDQVVEAAGGGVDTVSLSNLLGYTLPANVENLTVSGRSDVYGNALNNIITGAGNSQVIDGMGGNDILAGGAGADAFQFTRGSGYDVIADFSHADGDTIRLKDTPLLTWSAVQKAMTQDGSDVILRFDATDAVRIQNATVAAFTPQDFQFRIDTSKLVQTFAADFNSYPTFYDPKTGTGVFDSYLPFGNAYGPNSEIAHTHNDEQQIYVDSTYGGSSYKPLGIDPFSVSGGVLTITGEKTPTADLSALWNHEYVSGLLTTAHTFYQQYGYFEERAAMPPGQGMWPAFWLLPEDQTFGLELDVLEQVGTDTSYQTAHYWDGGVREKVNFGNHVFDATQFHTYGMLWTAKEVAWYIDGVEVVSIPTPADLNKPMYIVTNLALGGRWPGDVPADFTSAQMKIDYIHAYAVDPNATAATVNAGGGVIGGQLAGAAAADDILGSTINDTITGLGGDDTLDGRAGSDVLDGGAGSDTVVYDNVGGGVHVSLAVSGPQDTGASGSDTLVSIENLTGGKFNDTLGGDAGANVLNGRDGNDLLIGGGGADTLIGGTGVDTVSYAAATSKVTVDLGNGAPQNTGGGGVNDLSGIENVVGSAYSDTLRGDSGTNVIDAGKGTDSLDGANGSDTLIGGAGADVLTGGLGADVFVFSAKADSKGGAFDTIGDFSHVQKDVIDLSGVDADTTKAGDQAFTFIGGAAFSHHAGELRYAVDAAGLHIYGDTNGDGVADFNILCKGLSSIQASDFIL
jgi:Ca2+-binding RTX toxin-like protein